MPTENKNEKTGESRDDIVNDAEEHEDARIAAEEQSEIADEDADVATDAREGRIP